MRVLLVDDEPLALRATTRALEGSQDVKVIGSARDGDQALQLVAQLKPDLVILDIEMPGLNGMDVARTLNQPDAPDVIFLTAFTGYAVEAFTVEAVDYLLKPLRPERLHQALGRARERRRRHPTSLITSRSDAGAVIHVPDRHGGRDILQSEMIWVEAARDYAILHTTDRSHMLRTTMAELAEQLRPPLMRVHRSTFVALDRVRRHVHVGKGLLSLKLADGGEVTVGPSYTASVRAALNLQEQALKTCLLAPLAPSSPTYEG